MPVLALAASSMEDAANVLADERLVLYRDLMRVLRLWAYPGLQQQVRFRLAT